MTEQHLVAAGQSTIALQLDAARTALAQASDDFERVQIRDTAKAVQEAARILERREVQVEASLLVADAERALAKANPPAPVSERKQGQKGSLHNESITAAVTDSLCKEGTEAAIPSKKVMSQMRTAHDMPDAEYEAAKQRARERNEPITREQVRAVADASKIIHNPDVPEEVKTEVSRVVQDGGKPFEVKAARTRIENQRQAEQLRNNPIPLPQDVYRTIVIDPPWPMKKIERDVRPNQAGFDYPVMQLDEIEALDVPGLMHEDCVVFLWTTQKYLEQSFAIARSWGLKPQFTMVWHKPGGFQVLNRPQYNCEFVVAATQGSPRFLDTKAFPACFNAPRRGHSVKPDEFYEMVARVAAGPRLDMFNRAPREGFDAWGNEAQNE